jgi:hypothetical protein
MKTPVYLSETNKNVISFSLENHRTGRQNRSSLWGLVSVAVGRNWSKSEGG